MAPVPRGAVTAHAIQISVSVCAVVSTVTVLMSSNLVLRDVLFLLFASVWSSAIPTFMMAREHLELRSVYQRHPRLRRMRRHLGQPADLSLYTQGGSVIRCFADCSGQVLAVVRRGDVVEIVKVHLTDRSPRVEDYGVEIALARQVSRSIMALGFLVMVPFWLVVSGGFNHFLGLGLGWPIVVVAIISMSALTAAIPSGFMMARLIVRRCPEVLRMKEEPDIPRAVAEGLAGKRVVTCYRATESSWLAAVRERDVIRLVTVTNEEV